MNAVDPISIPVPSAVAVTAIGAKHRTGFPMKSGLMAFLASGSPVTLGNYPNPFRAGSENTTIEFYLPAPHSVSLVLYDVLGAKVKTLEDNQSYAAGLHQVLWDGKNGMGTMVLNGVYYAQLNVDGSKSLLKIAVVK